MASAPVIANTKPNMPFTTQFHLPGTLEASHIQQVLGGHITNIGQSTSGTENEWHFTADGQFCAIWRDARLGWCATGPVGIFEQLGIR